MESSSYLVSKPKFLSNKLTKQTDEESNVQIVYKNIFSVGSQANLSANPPIQQRDQYAQVSVVNFCSLQAKKMFRMTVESPNWIPMSFLGNSPSLLNDDYWLGALTETQSGLLQISPEGKEGNKFHPLCDSDKISNYASLPTLSHENIQVLATWEDNYVGFGVWDLSTDQPKCLAREIGYEDR